MVAFCWVLASMPVTGQRLSAGSMYNPYGVDLTGVNERKIPTPLDGSDPAWGPLRP